MSKRELGQLNGANEIEGPRTKRRRETAGVSSDVDVTSSDPIVSGGHDGGESCGVRKEEVQELGLKLWQTVKDAVNKEGRALSLDFLRRPPKRLYPDYYKLISQPIALDDIKKQLENGGYPTLEAVRQDFELCFNNAKQYNMKESDIWRDAKDLLKLVNKTYSKMVPADEDGENLDGDGKGKSKAPNLNRLLKSRLQKLVDKVDDSGRALSTEFMELPSKKDWPIYYKEIKRPQCFENIFKHIKRKEYHNAGDFAADVELVFANAMTFNQEHTGIWEDAKTLRDCFRILMSDMPPPYSLPEYAVKPKIKIKPQPAQPSTSFSAVPPAQPVASSSQTLRIPALKQAKVSPVSTPATPAVPFPAATETPPHALPPAVPAAQPTQLSSMGVPQPMQYMNTTFSHYPNASYIPPVPAPAAPTASTSTSNLPTDTVLQAHSTSNSPAPQLHPSHQLKSVSLIIQPRGRSLHLDHEDGVKCWAMRLIPGETEVHVSQVAFLGDGEEESSGGEEEGEHEEEEEEGVNAPAKNGRKRGKAKGRGRPKGTTRAATKAKAATAKKKLKIGPIQVKLNGGVVQEQEDETGKWIVSPAVGSSVLEVGESGGLVWKVYFCPKFGLFLATHLIHANPLPSEIHSAARCTLLNVFQNFDDDGSVRQRCISSCKFAHPGDPDWATASRYVDYKGRGGYRGRGGRFASGSKGAPSKSSPRRRNSSWESASSRQASTSNSIPWDKSSWGDSKPYSNIEASTSSKKTGSVLDKRLWESTPSPVTKEKDSDWGNWGSGSGSPWGTGTADAASVWGSNNASSGRGDNNASSGWGDAKASAWGSGSSEKASGWEGIGASPWDSSDTVEKGKGKAVGERDTQWEKGWDTGSGGWDTEPQPPPQAISMPHVAPKDNSPRTTTTIPPTASRLEKTTNEINLPDRPPSTNVAQPLKERNESRSALLKICTQAIPAAEPILSSKSDSARPSEIPDYSSIVRQIQRTIQYHIEFEDAQANVERWKRTQTSQQFLRATPATRTILDSQRLSWAQRAGKLKQDLTSSIKRLSELHRLLLQSKALVAHSREAHVRQELMKYTTDLRDWIQSLELSIRAPELPPTNPLPEPAKPKDAKELIQDQIQASFRSVDDLNDLINDALYSRNSVPIDVDTRVATLRDAQEKKKRDVLASTEASTKSLLEEATQVGDDLGELSEHTATLLETLHFNTQTLTQLNVELEQSQKAKEQVQAYLKQLAELKQSDDAKIRDLTERVQNLYTIPRPSRPPISPDVLISNIQALIIGDLRAEIISLVDRLREACSQSSHNFITELSARWQPILDATDDVCRRAEIITARQSDLQA
ncbi:hypothetical protein D9615_001251 [Tricholomella constricta]|uniref:Bromo domain-containing protein n=1 Tax=Tricholomella constricta TaxID=117010 RepID=A0A8H5HL86_9AGAR|nr:hypothetical protein D9615_001251 [Tricholomella constricta]